VNRPKLSVCIPYRARMHNLQLVLDALSRQTLPASDFEVIIGAMDQDEELVHLCRSYSDHLDAVLVVSRDQFAIPKARNLAMRQARGSVVVQMDADTLLPPQALARLWHHHMFDQQVCSVGQVTGYGNNQDGDVVELTPPTAADCIRALAEVSGVDVDPLDPRFRLQHVLPWAFAWTGLIALPTDAVREHGLWFDESFVGWGVDDLEWGFRVARSRLPIIMRRDVIGVHLPHLRDAAANEKTERANYGCFLRKWPCRDVEFAAVVGDIEANNTYLGYLETLAGLHGAGNLPAVVVTKEERGWILHIGVPVPEHGPHDTPRPAQPRLGNAAAVLPLTGVALPFPDGYFAASDVDPALERLPERLRTALEAEVRRVVARPLGKTVRE
jgi:glycosyltransferase involved in cell wall biosynthesis